MPVSVARRNGKYRLLEPDGSIATTPQGNPRDGGGHPTRNMAGRQARAINSSLAKSYLSQAAYHIAKALSALTAA